MPETAGALDADALLEEIRGLLTDSDNALLGILTDGFVPDNLTPEFYARALSARNAFIREYFLWDLQVRNVKTDYLNRTLGRPQGTDLIPLPEGCEPEDRGAIEEVLESTDILGREKGLDNLMWRKADELVLMHLFDLDLILCFIVKIKITDRWNKLDPATGRELFRSMVEEIRKKRQA